MVKLWSVVLKIRSLVNVDVAWMHFEENASKVFSTLFSEERYALTRTRTYRPSRRYLSYNVSGTDVFNRQQSAQLTILIV